MIELNRFVKGGDPMKKIVLLILCLLLAACAFAESGDPSPALSLQPGEVTGEFDAPAFTNPEARYTDYFVEATDGSENAIFMFLDFMNDEAEDMKDGGSLIVTEHWGVSEDNPAGTKVSIQLQQSPFGPMMIARTKVLWITETVYFCGEYAFMGDDDGAEAASGNSAEEMEFYTTAYHFPYGRLECLQGVRQDENGYTYFFVKSDDDMSFEFVIGAEMRIVQLRVYVRNDEGALLLNNTVDYETGPAAEIPQAVLDAFGEVMPTLPEATEPPQDEADESGETR